MTDQTPGTEKGRSTGVDLAHGESYTRWRCGCGHVEASEAAIMAHFKSAHPWEYFMLTGPPMLKNPKEIAQS